MRAFIRLGVAVAWAAATLASVAAPDSRSAATARAGELVYARCLACHALAYDRTGPRHCGLFGRRAGSVPGFTYSDAMRSADIVWTAKTLDRFLRDPMKSLPGTSMGYAGVKDDKERAALIEYLRQANTSRACTQGR